jgi:hypothetical protein
LSTKADRQSAGASSFESRRMGLILDSFHCPDPRVRQ